MYFPSCSSPLLFFLLPSLSILVSSPFSFSFSSLSFSSYLLLLPLLLLLSTLSSYLTHFFPFQPPPIFFFSSFPSLSFSYPPPPSLPLPHPRRPLFPLPLFANGTPKWHQKGNTEEESQRHKGPFICSEALKEKAKQRVKRPGHLGERTTLETHCTSVLPPSLIPSFLPIRFSFLLHAAASRPPLSPSTSSFQSFPIRSLSFLFSFSTSQSSSSPPSH